VQCQAIGIFTISTLVIGQKILSPLVSMRAMMISWMMRFEMPISRAIGSCRHRRYPFLRISMMLTIRSIQGELSLDAMFVLMRCKTRMKLFVTFLFSPCYASARGGSRTRRLRESDELERDPPTRFFNAFKKKEPINVSPSQKPGRSGIFLRNNVSKGSHSQVGM
jgi:hypothetical protein